MYRLNLHFLWITCVYLRGKMWADSAKAHRCWLLTPYYYMPFWSRHKHYETLKITERENGFGI